DDSASQIFSRLHPDRGHVRDGDSRRLTYGTTELDASGAAISHPDAGHVAGRDARADRNHAGGVRSISYNRTHQRQFRITLSRPVQEFSMAARRLRIGDVSRRSQSDGSRVLRAQAGPQFFAHRIPALADAAGTAGDHAMTRARSK